MLLLLPCDISLLLLLLRLPVKELLPLLLLMCLLQGFWVCLLHSRLQRRVWGSSALGWQQHCCLLQGVL